MVSVAASVDANPTLKARTKEGDTELPQETSNYFVFLPNNRTLSGFVICNLSDWIQTNPGAFLTTELRPVCD